MSRRPPKFDSAASSYEVGYGKPPGHTQFKPGQSGNPRGRPRGHKNFRTIVEQTLSEKVTIREGERQRKISKAEAIVRRLVNNALQGDTKFTMAFLQVMRATGLIGEGEGLGLPTSADDESADRQALLAAYVARQTNGNASSAPSPVLAPPELLDDDLPDETDEK